MISGWQQTMRGDIDMLEDRYHLIIRRSKQNKNGEAGEVLVNAYDISLVCAYNIIKLYGNCVELKLRCQKIKSK